MSRSYRAPEFEALEPRLLLDGDLAVTGVRPVGGEEHPFDRIELAFNHPVQEDTFDTGDILVAGPAGELTPTGLTREAPDRYVLELDSLTGREAYSLRIGPDVLGDNGQPMDQNGNGTPGEADDAYEASLMAGGFAIADGDTQHDGRHLIVHGGAGTIVGDHDSRTWRSWAAGRSSLPGRPSASRMRFSTRARR